MTTTLVSSNGVVTDSTGFCPHRQTRQEILSPGGKHYGRVSCVDCGRFLCWLPNPRNVEQRQQNAIHVRELLNSNRLTQWEEGFCFGIQNTPRLSPRQQDVLNQLVAKHLLKGDNIHGSENRNGPVRYDRAAH
jgi:hypothetical protein